MDATEATATYNCRHPDCTDTARSSRGPYAYCDYHREYRAKHREQAKAPAAGGFEARARALVAAGRDLDRARAHAEQALERVRAAQAAYDGALEAVTSGHTNGG